MNVIWKRSLAILLVLCTVVSLMGTAALAVNEGGTTADSTAGTTVSDTTVTGTGLSDSTVISDGETEGDSGGGSTPSTTTTVKITFRDYAGQTLIEIDHTPGTLSDAEIESIKEKLPAGGVSGWIGTGAPSGSCVVTTDTLNTLSLTGAWTFDAAWCVTYKEDDGTEISREYVKNNALPASAPDKTADSTAIVGWLDADGNAVSLSAITADTVYTAVVGKHSTTTDDTYTVTFYDYDGTKLNEMKDVAAGSKLTADDIPLSAYKKNTAVSYWLMEDGFSMSEYTPETLIGAEISGTTNIYAAWRVTYCDTDGKTALSSEYVLMDHAPLSAPVYTGSDVSIAGWLDATGKAITLSEQKITCDTTYTAWVRPSLNTDPTIAYISGSAETDKTVYRFQPNGSLTRAEAATMIYNLLSSADRSGGPMKDIEFTDVKSTSWYYNAVHTLASYGILNGTGGGKFEPNTYITRAQFVTMLSRLFPVASLTGDSPFKDVTNKTTSYYNAVVTAYYRSWITGYEQSDGSLVFRPLNTITRAEAVKILGGMLGRNAESETAKASIDSLDRGIFTDIADSWAYYWIMDAATGGGSNLPTTKLSAGRHKIDGKYYFVDSNGRFIRKERGLHQMDDGKYYFFTKNGIAAPVYSAGLRRLGDDNDLYLLNSDGSIIHEPKSGYDTRVYEYNGYMYYIQEDGTLLQNEYFGPLYFCENGYYTSGHNELDSWVYGFVSGIINSSKSQEDKLYAAYLQMIEYPLQRYGAGNAGYFRYSWSGKSYKDLAAEFFKYARGDCGYWASAMVFLARRIGYQAWIESGKLGTGRGHLWEVIEIRGTKYTFDVEQEWGYKYKYYSEYRLDMDCWKMTYNPGKAIKYGTRFKNSSYGSYYAGAKNVWSPYYGVILDV